MKVKGRLIFKGEDAKLIVRSLEPDNLSEKTIIEDHSATVIFSGDRIGTVLSSLDDYLMNAKVAHDIKKVINNEKTKPKGQEYSGKACT